MGHCKLHSRVSRQGRLAAGEKYLRMNFFLCSHFHTASLVAFLAGLLRKVKGSARQDPAFGSGSPEKTRLDPSLGSCCCFYSSLG